MSKYKEKKPSLVDFTKRYSNNEEACYQFFFKVRYPDGYVCEKCGCKEYKRIPRYNVSACNKCHHQQCLFAGTIFQDNKLPLYTLLLGLFLFFSSNKGISAMEMRSQLNVNYKTALLLCRKCRILMKQVNDSEIMDAMFYEADTAYIGAKSKSDKCQGMATEKQPFLAMLSTMQENKYPRNLKLYPISQDTSINMARYISKGAVLTKERLLNTDGKTTFNVLRDTVTLKAEIIDYDKPDHKLHWLNIVIGNVKSQITGIYHGVSKRDLPLFLSEQEYRFNHRNEGMTLMDKVAEYLSISKPFTKKDITKYLDDLEPSFNRNYFKHSLA